MDRAAPPISSARPGGATAVDPLATHRTRMRRARRWYALAIAVLLLIAAGVIARVWYSSEIRHTTLHSALAPNPQLSPQPAAATVRQAWRSGDRTAHGVPYWGGTVVTWNAHSMYGLDAATGGIRWSYTRTDRRLCTVLSTQNRAIAVYAHDANCDEVTAVAVDTGQRAWTRTLTDNGTPTMTAGLYSILFITPGQVHAVDPQSGIDRWIYTEADGCSTRSAVLGGSGTLISQHCADGDHLLLRDPYKGTDDKSGVVTWTINSRLVPVSADNVISAFDPQTGALQLLSADKGQVVRTLTLAAAPQLTPDQVGQAAVGNTELVWLAGRLYAITGSAAQPEWTADTASMPTVTGPSRTANPDTLADATLAVGSPNGIDELDPATGAVSRSWSVPAPPRGAAVFPLGAGFLVADGDTVVYR